MEENEIEKLYENARVNKFGKRSCTTCEYLDCQNYCFISENNKCTKFNYEYPPFTAEKQLNIVKFLLNKSVYYDTYGDREYWFHLSDEIENSKYSEFDEAIAECINKMWNDLRDYEKMQIKDILQ